jgi:mRNA interferase MazF
MVWLEFDPQAGHEQAGHRPALVLSPATYNGKTGLMVCCPLTTRIKGYPFEVTIKGNPASVVLADQVKSLDWQARRATRKGRVLASELAEVRAKLKALIG